MNIEEKVKNLQGCLNQANGRINFLVSQLKSLENSSCDDYLRINKRLNKLETPPKKWWQRIKFEI